ncbi:MAG: ABC transporter permease [Bacteroidales bacterium]|nr:ABC transporter permease [Bacteroidales bacterium]MBQ9173186.1 ABC transporter permease [Bacteroidales bacterium]MBR1436024.1 ABC transporter permease [Bacteroidales bacterium]
MAKRETYARTWLKDFCYIACNELKQIFSDGGVMLIFFVAGLLYPLLYNVVYLNGILNDTPIAVVDEAACSESRRYIRELDATREVEIAYKCINMDEAERLMKERKVNGIVLFPRDFGEKIQRMETSTISVYCDMSCFLYYKNVLMSTNHVMLHEIGRIQVERYAAAGFTDIEAAQLVQGIPYEENNPYNQAFSYSIFLLSAILLVIIQQTLFYGMSLLVGTQREQNRSFASLPYHLQGHGMGRVVLGRGFAYWGLYMAIGIYIALIVPAIFGLPQRGQFWNIMALLLFFVTDCVYFSMTFSTLITKRESVFVLFLFMSPICLFLTGTSWPTTAIPGFWKVFSYIFPTTFGVQAFINMSTAGGDLSTAHDQMIALTIQTVVYFFLSTVAVYIENWIIRHKEEIEERKAALEKEIGIDFHEEDRKMIAGE